MSEEKLEKYWNKVYYDYLEQEEAEELIEYYKNMEQENKQLKEKIDILLEDNNQLEEIRIKTIEYIKRTIKIIKEQPSSCELNDIWILEHLNSFLEILGDKE